MQKTYKFIVDYTTKHLYPPSIREICKATGYKSTNTVYTQLRALEDCGLIKITGRTPRCIQLLGYKLIREGENQ